MSVSSSSSGSHRKPFKTSDRYDNFDHITPIKTCDPEPASKQQQSMETPQAKDGMHPYAQAIQTISQKSKESQTSQSKGYSNESAFEPKQTRGKQSEETQKTTVAVF